MDAVARAVVDHGRPRSGSRHCPGHVVMRAGDLDRAAGRDLHRDIVVVPADPHLATGPGQMHFHPVAGDQHRPLVARHARGEPRLPVNDPPVLDHRSRRRGIYAPGEQQKADRGGQSFGHGHASRSFASNSGSLIRSAPARQTLHAHLRGRRSRSTSRIVGCPSAFGSQWRAGVASGQPLGMNEIPHRSYTTPRGTIARRPRRRASPQRNSAGTRSRSRTKQTSSALATTSTASR